MSPSTETIKSASNAPTLRETAIRRHRSLGLVPGCLLLTLAAFLLWNEVLKYRFVAKRWGIVVPGAIYRSGQVSKWVLKDKLKEHKIQVIIDLNGIDSHDEHQVAEIKTARRLGIGHHRFPLSGDGTGDIRNYAKAIQVLADCQHEGKAVLVHCAAGAQRTGGVVAAFRVLLHGESPQRAYAELSQYGWKAHKDQDLLTYLNSHMRELAEILVEMQVIDQVPEPLPDLGPEP